MKKESAFATAIKTPQGKVSFLVLIVSTLLCFLVCIFASQTKLIYLALAFSLISVAACNNFIGVLNAVREDKKTK